MDRSVYWRSSKLSFDENWRHLLATGLFSDIKITVKDFDKQKTFDGHKLLLMMISPVFEVMLSGNYKEKNEILIKDVNPDAFQIFFSYMYSQTVDIQNLSSAWAVYQLASKYIVQPVSDFCIEYIQQNCSIETCAINYNYAELFSLEDIRLRNYEFILSELPTFFGRPEFLNLSKTAIVSILDEPVLSVSESDLFKNLEKWIRAQIHLKGEKMEKEQLRKVLNEELVQKIHFLEMTPSEFADAVGSSQTLTQPQKLSIFMNISSNKEHPLEDGVRKFEKKRLKNLDCICQGNKVSCKIGGIELHCVQFKGSSNLILYNIHLGPSGTSMSFRFKFNSKTDAVLFNATNFRIEILNSQLSVVYFVYHSYNNTERRIKFNKIVTDGRLHMFSLSFASQSFHSTLDGSEQPQKIVDWHNGYINQPMFGSSNNQSKVQFCLSSVSFGNSSGCIDFKDYHSSTDRISLCHCMSSE